jgi:hypothetical protein
MGLNIVNFCGFWVLGKAFFKHGAHGGHGEKLFGFNRDL